MFERILFAFVIMFLIVLAIDISDQERALAKLSADVQACKLEMLDGKKIARK